MLRSLLNLFSRYVHPFEKRVDKVLHSISERSSRNDIELKLLKLMQENLVIMNVWLEYKFKGYKHLKKSVRSELYENASNITQNFEEFIKQNPIQHEEVSEKLLVLGVDFNARQVEKFGYIMQIMEFLQPGNRYQYLESTSFDRLLANLDQGQQMIGDCNQIVTLYIYLYSRKYDINELELKLIPGHIALHFNGVDIEATAAVFHRYQEYEALVPVIEIISTNLLDVKDSTKRSYEISEQTILKSAQLANAISSKKDLVQKNLQIAYTNLAVSALHRKDFQEALSLYKLANRPEEFRGVYHSAAIFYAKKNKYSSAKAYALKTGDEDLQKAIKSQEAYYYYQKRKYKKAIKLYTDLNDKQMLKACYQQIYNQLYETVKNDQTLKQQKSHKSTYSKMYKLAKQIGNQDLVDQLSKLLKQI